MSDYAEQAIHTRSQLIDALNKSLNKLFDLVANQHLSEASLQNWVSATRSLVAKATQADGGTKDRVIYNVILTAARYAVLPPSIQVMLAKMAAEKAGTKAEIAGNKGIYAYQKLLHWRVDQSFSGARFEPYGEGADVVQDNAALLTSTPVKDKAVGELVANVSFIDPIENSRLSHELDIDEMILNAVPKDSQGQPVSMSLKELNLLMDKVSLDLENEVKAMSAHSNNLASSGITSPNRGGA